MPKKHKILVVDDEMAFCKSLTTGLKKYGFDVIFAVNGGEALSMITNEKPDLITLDICMPGDSIMPAANGLEVLNKGKDLNKNMKIIMVSATEFVKDENSFKAIGAHAVHKKPIDFNELLATIKRLLKIPAGEGKDIRPLETGKSILIVDDEKNFCKQIELFLKKTGYESFSVNSGLDALKYVKSNNPDLILLDIRMPGIDGIETLRRIKGINSDNGVIMLSAVDDIDSSISAFMNGADGFLKKPADLKELSLVLGQTLEKKRLIKENKEYHQRLEEMYKTLKKANKEIIRALAQAIEAKDPYTKGHCDRVTTLSLRLGKEIGLSDTQLEIVEYGALLHDVGKIGVRETVLNKPGGLQEDELNHIREHPLIGEKILGNIDFLKEATDIVKHHHERFDGQGYPDHLKSGKSKLMSQIVVIADAFDAMTSDRPYRKGMDIQRALSILDENKGSQFNPELVEIFVNKKLYSM